MKFVPRNLGESGENSSGGGATGSIKEAATLTVLIIAAMTCLYFIVAILTDIGVARISPEQEAKLFGSFKRLDTGVKEPPEAYREKIRIVESILERLSGYPSSAPLDYHIIFVDSPDPNAFAFPGGGIGVTSGLLDALENEISMAFVIGHELGHFANRDHLRGMGRRVGFTLALRILFGGGLDSLTSKGADLMLLKYSRNQELKADIFALDCLDSVYGSRDGADRLFEVLESKEKIPDWAYMFSTHPDSHARLRILSEKYR